MHACDRNRSLGLPVINQEASMTTTIIIIIKISRKKRKRKLNISFKYPNRIHYQKKNKQNPKKTNKNKQNQISNAISQTLIHPNQHPSINPSYKSSSSSKKKSTKSKETKRSKRVHFPTFLEIPNTTCVIVRPYNMYYSSLCHCAGKRVGEQSRPRHGCLLVRVTESRVTRVDYNWTSIYPFLLAHPEYVHTRTCL